MAGQDKCWNHSESTAEQRKANASKGAEARHAGGPLADLRAAKRSLAGLRREVRRGEIATGTAVVLVQILNAELRAVEIERRVIEQDEIIAEIERIKDALAS